VAAPLGHLSNATRVGNRLYVAGLVSLDEQGELVGGGSIREQTLQILRSLERICEQHGADLTAVARCLVFITDRAGYAEYDAAFAEAFGSHKPARATVIADLVNPDFLVEIVSDVELPAG
jgi:enamine deaminase RidA (YjgF/YER057c/UK114 family)